jgi:hypothetical protein
LLTLRRWNEILDSETYPSRAKAFAEELAQSDIILDATNGFRGLACALISPSYEIPRDIQDAIKTDDHHGLIRESLWTARHPGFTSVKDYVKEFKADFCLSSEYSIDIHKF